MQQNRKLARLALATLVVLLAAPRAARPQARTAGPGDPDTAARLTAVAPRTVYGPASPDALLDETFRIDIRTIDVRFDYFPDQNVVDAVAHLEFVMRPGQTVPRFHFAPAARSAGVVRSFAVDGEVLSFTSAVTIPSVPGSTQPILEVNRRLAEGVVHSIDLAYRLSRPSVYPRFSTEVNDMAGHGNEELFPTLNTPHELARHRFALRVHGARAYQCIGSGLVERRDDADADVQQWLLDTERDVASYTVMFALLPAADTDLQERVISGIPVRILAFRTGGASIASAFATLEDWLPRLEAAFGLYPAPRGLNVFLVTSGGGMEYFGGTISTASALTHEVVHNYFACAVVTKTYRDSWLDEAIAQWFDDVSHGRSYAPLDDSYRGNWVGARSPVSVGYSNLAYSDGARIMQAMANRVGGTSRMAQFLRYVYERHAFEPFTTTDFVSYFRDFSGIDLQPSFEQWLYRSVGR